MSKKGLELFKEEKYELAFKKFTIYVKNTKNRGKEYYDTHKLIDTILEKHTLSLAILKWLNKYKKSSEILIITAKVNYFGSGVKRDYLKSVEDLKLSKTPLSMYLLGNMYTNGSGVKKDEQKALQLYKKSCMLQNMYAEYTIANISKMDGDIEKAIIYYRLSAIQGYSIAQYSLGLLLEKTDEKEALVWFDKSYKQGYKKGGEKIKYKYELFNGVTASIKCYEKCLEEDPNDLKIVKKLIKLYKTQMPRWWYNNALHLIIKNRLVKLCDLLIKTGDIDAMYELGLVHKLVSRDCKMLQKAANLGHSQAQYILGFLNWNNQNKVQVNACIKWLEKSAKQSNVDALYKLGELYYYGYPRYRYYGNVIKADKIKAQVYLEKCVEVPGISKDDVSVGQAKKVLSEVYLLSNKPKAFKYASESRDGCQIKKLLNQKNILKEISEDIYIEAGLKDINPCILSPGYQNIKTFIETGKKNSLFKANDSSISSFFDMYINHNKNKIKEMRKTLNSTSLYVKVLCDIIEKYSSPKF
jgi:TPR repeat protein